MPHLGASGQHGLGGRAKGLVILLRHAGVGLLQGAGGTLQGVLRVAACVGEDSFQGTVLSESNGPSSGAREVTIDDLLANERSVEWGEVVYRTHGLKWSTRGDGVSYQLELIDDSIRVTGQYI